MVPDRATVWGLPFESLETDIAPAWNPNTVGLNTTLILQLALAPRELPQVFVPLNSPVKEMLLIVSAIFPGLETVTLFEALVVPMA